MSEKIKKQMTPEARQRMLDNLAKGRAAKAAKLKKLKQEREQNAEQNTIITNDKSPEEKREIDETTLGKNTGPLDQPVDHKLTCPGCRKVFKHSSSKSKHVKKCKFIATNNVVHPSPAAVEPNPQETSPAAVEPNAPAVETNPQAHIEPEYEMETIPRRRKKKPQKVTIIESESSSSEEELVITKKRRGKKLRHSPAPSPAPAPAPTLNPEQMRLREEHQKILMLSRQMQHGGQHC